MGFTDAMKSINDAGKYLSSTGDRVMGEGNGVFDGGDDVLRFIMNLGGSIPGEVVNIAPNAFQAITGDDLYDDLGYQPGTLSGKERWGKAGEAALGASAFIPVGAIAGKGAMAAKNLKNIAKYDEFIKGIHHDPYKGALNRAAANVKKYGPTKRTNLDTANSGGGTLIPDNRFPLGDELPTTWTLPKRGLMSKEVLNVKDNIGVPRYIRDNVYESPVPLWRGYGKDPSGIYYTPDKRIAKEYAQHGMNKTGKMLGKLFDVNMKKAPKGTKHLPGEYYDNLTPFALEPELGGWEAYILPEWLAK